MAKGVTNGALTQDPLDYCILAAGTAVAWVYAIELNITIFLTFKRRGGLYFWSLLISSWGLTFHALGFILKFLVGTSWLLNIPLITTGWVAMVTGQSFVLYSRLHLVVRSQKILRYLLFLILFNVMALHIPTVVFTYGSNSPNANTWIGKFNVMERIQLAGFCIQETIISAVYVWATVRMLSSIYHSSTRTVMIQLIFINLCCIGMDIALICLEYTNEYVGEASIKPMIYAIKLKLEFTILNQLMSMATAGLTEGHRRGLGRSYELHSHPSSLHNAPSSSAKTGIRRITAVKDTPTASRPEDATPDPNGIYMTHQIQVVSEDAHSPPNLSQPNPRSPAPHAVLLGDQNRVRSLMGTTYVLGNQPSSPRSPRSPSAADGSRNLNLTESEEEIMRHIT